MALIEQFLQLLPFPCRLDCTDQRSCKCIKGLFLGSAQHHGRSKVSLPFEGRQSFDNILLDSRIELQYPFPQETHITVRLFGHWISA